MENNSPLITTGFRGLDALIRPNIRTLKPYSSARHEFTGEAQVFLDANENSFGSPLPDPFNRYPDPLQWQVKFQLARVKGIPAENIFIGNGSDEVIDLAYRIFCEPGLDNVIVCPPTYGMYQVNAQINNVAVRQVPLTSDFQLDVEGILQAVDAHTKLLFVCSPNNPTGNSMRREDVELVLNNFPGLVIIDEAYINYARQKSFMAELTEYPNLIVMQTLSKAWGLAALRVGMAFASLDIIDWFNKVKPPYNINDATQQLVLEALGQTDLVNSWIRDTVDERERLARALRLLPMVQRVFASDANFLLVQVADADAVYAFLSAAGIVVRNRSKEPGCAQCLRITIGTPEENDRLLIQLNAYSA